MKNYLKMFVIAVIILLTADANAKPWNNNTREHLFGTIDGHNQAHVSIQDEGFRWRSSFNFTINGHSILPENWWFNRVVQVNESNGLLEPCNDFVRNIVFYDHGKYRSISPNFIHSHLAKIADKVKQINGCASATTAAVTMVIENSGNYYAFSKILCNDSNQIIATRTLTNNGNVNEIISYPDFTAINIRNTIETTLPIINSNIPNPNKYSCSEGQIVAKIKSNNFELVKRIIKELLMKAKQQYGNEINYNNIKLVVLHIGTTMDPCAICTRCLVGLSKYTNGSIDNFLRCTDPGSPDGTINNSKFFVEVSSNGHYATAIQYNRTTGMQLSDDRQDNFAAFGCGNCSHTECAGHDGGEANPINVSLNFSSIAGLAIPYGIPSNWVLSTTFPPYVVFGRANNAYNVDNAPAHCGIPNHVHNARNNLPIIQ